jgi:hypothetical protein
MDGLPRSSTARRLRAGAGRAAPVAVTAPVGIVASPGTASATGTGTVEPVLDCHEEAADGSRTVVVGAALVHRARTRTTAAEGRDDA